VQFAILGPVFGNHRMLKKNNWRTIQERNLGINKFGKIFKVQD